MTIVRVRGFQIFNDRHGRPRCYHRKTGEPIDLVKAPIGTAEFMAECARISATARSTEPKPGTLGMLITAYRAHPAFTDLAPRTKSDYQAVFQYLKPIADTVLTRFDKPLIVRIRDKAAQSKGRKFDDVHRPWTAGRAGAAQELLQGERDSDQAVQDRRAGVLAVPRAADGYSG
jgi:hypothetical protein